MPLTCKNNKKIWSIWPNLVGKQTTRCLQSICFQIIGSVKWGSPQAVEHKTNCDQHYHFLCELPGVYSPDKLYSIHNRCGNKCWEKLRVSWTDRPPASKQPLRNISYGLMGPDPPELVYYCAFTWTWALGNFSTYFFLVRPFISPQQKIEILKWLLPFNK